MEVCPRSRALGVAESPIGDPRRPARCGDNGGMQVVPATVTDVERFVQLSWDLHGGDPRWVAPMRQPLLAELCGQTAFDRYGSLQPFLCRSGAQVVGRVAAIVNPRIRDGSGAPIGQIGYFECVDDAGAAAALLDAAAEWLKARGATVAWGPMNGGAHRAHRLMTMGFERDPFLLEPRNPSYYPALFEGWGFARARVWESFELTLADLRGLLAGKGFERAVARASRSYHVEPVDTTLGEQALGRIHRLLDGVWEGHVGYGALELDEFVEAYGGLLAILSDRWFCTVQDVLGRDVGLAFMYPDYVDEVRRLRGDVTGWGRFASAASRRMVMHTLAFLPEARRTGAPFLSMAAGMRHMEEDGLHRLVVALVDEDFRVFASVSKATRRYALYACGLS